MNPKARNAKAEETLLGQLAAASGEAALDKLVAGNRKLLHAGIVDRLSELAREKARVNPQESLRAAEAALAVGRAIGNEEALARGLRAKANALWVVNQNRPAVELFDQAATLYEKCGNQTELGRTLSSSIQALIRTGEYGRALEGSNRAREIFERSGDTLRLARLELNVANIHHHQDRFAEAQAAYEKAYRQLVPLRDTEAIAVALHNMAVCLIGLNDFEKAPVMNANLNGAVCVAAAGNDGLRTMVYPAGYSNQVMGVASTSNSDTRSTFSNYGQNLVWVAAPGEGVVTLYPFGTYAATWGTSFSTPFVAGTAALMREIAGADEWQAAGAIAHAKYINSDLANGRLDVYQAVLAWRQWLGLM